MLNQICKYRLLSDVVVVAMLILEQLHVEQWHAMSNPSFQRDDFESELEILFSYIACMVVKKFAPCSML